MKEIITLFIDNIPGISTHLWLRKTFSNYGVVRDAFIPAKRSSKTGSKFGFVRYDCSVSVDMAILKANGMEVEDKKLVVKLADFVKRLSPYQPLRKPLHKPLCRAAFAAPTIVGDKEKIAYLNHNVGSHKSYAHALIGSAKDVGICGERNATLKFQPSGNGWLHRSAVAVLHKMISVDDLRVEVQKEIGGDILIRAMGGRNILITFPSTTFMDELIEKDWYERWFVSIKPWNGEAASMERFVWISCIGVPLNVWNSLTFKKIGGQWGDFIAVDEDTLKESSFAISKILIATKIHSKIEEVINLDIDGNIYLVRVSEVFSSHLPFSILSHSNQYDGFLASPNLHKTPMDAPILVFNSNEEDAKAEARLDIGDSVSNNLHQVVNDSLEDNAILRQEDSTGSRAIDSPSISASMVGESKEEVDCSMANDVGNLVDTRHPSSSVGPVANSKLSNSFEVEDTVLAVTNKDEEVVNFDQGFWNLSEVEFFNDKDVEGIQLVVDLNPTNAVEDIGKGKLKQKRIGKKLGFPKAKKKGRRKQKKCVVFRSAIAAAALSVSSDSINRIHLNTAQASRSISKILGEDFLGDDDEIISGFSVAS